MLPFDLDNLTYNELLGTYAAPLVDKAETVNIDPEYSQEIFLYRLVNDSDVRKYVHLHFTQSFNGKIEVYNNTEVLKQQFSITDTEIIVDQTEMYNISAADFYQRYYNDQEEREDFTAADHLLTLSSQTDIKTKTSTFNVGLEPSEKALVLLNVIPSTFYLTTSYEDGLHLEALPDPAPQSVAPNSAIGFISTDTTQSIKVGDDMPVAVKGAPTKFKVEGFTDKIIRATIKYGNTVVSSGYFYNPQAIANVAEALNEVIPVIGDENITLIPISERPSNVDASGNEVFSLVELDVVWDAAAQVTVAIDTPLPNTAVSMRIKTETLTSTTALAVHDDPYSQYARPGETGTNALRRLRALGFI